MIITTVIYFFLIIYIIVKGFLIFIKPLDNVQKKESIQDSIYLSAMPFCLNTEKINIYALFINFFIIFLILLLNLNSYLYFFFYEIINQCIMNSSTFCMEGGDNNTNSGNSSPIILLDKIEDFESFENISYSYPQFQDIFGTQNNFTVTEVKIETKTLTQENENIQKNLVKDVLQSNSEKKKLGIPEPYLDEKKAAMPDPYLDEEKTAIQDAYLEEKKTIIISQQDSKKILKINLKEEKEESSLHQNLFTYFEEKKPEVQSSKLLNKSRARSPDLNSNFLENNFKKSKR